MATDNIIFILIIYFFSRQLTALALVSYSHRGLVDKPDVSDACPRNLLLFLFKVNSQNTKYDTLLCMTNLYPFLHNDMPMKNNLFSYALQAIPTQLKRECNISAHICHSHKIQIA